MLTKDEILENWNLFVGSQATNYGEDLTRKHDELWGILRAAELPVVGLRRMRAATHGLTDWLPKPHRGQRKFPAPPRMPRLPFHFCESMTVPVRELWSRFCCVWSSEPFVHHWASFKSRQNVMHGFHLSFFLCFNVSFSQFQMSKHFKTVELYGCIWHFWQQWVAIYVVSWRFDRILIQRILLRCLFINTFINEELPCISVLLWRMWKSFKAQYLKTTQKADKTL